MSDKPLWHDDVFACYAPMIERLQTLVADGMVKIVKEADDIGDLVGDTPTLKPLDGALYVVFDSIIPTTDQSDRGKNQTHEIGFSLIYTVKKYSFRPLSGFGIGRILAHIAHRMNGFEPVQEGRATTLGPFMQRSPLPVQYKNGFGYFALRYVTTVATYADH